MNCNKCDGTCIKNGFQVNGQQRYLCKMCKYGQQEYYVYNACKKRTNETIVKLLVNSCGIRDISRILSISKTTVITRILAIADGIKTQRKHELNQIYEVDKLCAKFSGKKSCCWISYALNRNKKQIINFSIGSNNKEKLAKVINSILCLNPNRVYTDKLPVYRGLIPAAIHSDRKYQTNTIERFNLNIRTHLKRLSRKSICFSNIIVLLTATIKIYFWYMNHFFNCKNIQISLPLRLT